MKRIQLLILRNTNTYKGNRISDVVENFDHQIKTVLSFNFLYHFHEIAQKYSNVFIGGVAMTEGNLFKLCSNKNKYY
jgi:hypothetical protein